jgi:rhamnose utilization protein RhaD (predicted bifunctional aldolase and dehydrogenase)
MRSGSDEDLVLHGGGNTSVKAPYVNIFGESIDSLYVKGSGWDLAVSHSTNDA